MPHYLLSAETSFSAAHTLPDVDECEQFHGHNWRVRLTIRIDGDQLDRTGMIIDFRDLEKTVREVVNDFDHAYLNEVEPFREIPPTSERIALVVSERASSRLAEIAPSVSVEEVEVWEMPGYRVSYRPK